MAPHLNIALDTEGYFHSPWSVQVSTRPGEALCIRANDVKGIAELKRWLETERPVIAGHNLLHDVRVMRSMGIDLLEMELGLDDTMLAAYELGVIPMGLKALSVRECGMPMLSYKEVLGDAQERHARTYMIWLWDGENERYKAMCAEEFDFQTRVVGRRIKKVPRLPKLPLMKVAERVLGSKDPYRLWNDQVIDTHVEAHKRLGPMQEASLSDVEPGLALRYAARDPDATGRLRDVLLPRVREQGLEGVYRLDLGTYPILDRMMAIGMQPDPAAFAKLAVLLDAEIATLKARLALVTGWPDFNPNSGDQTAEYVFGVLGLEVLGKRTDSGRGSTNDKVLEALEKMYPEYPVLADIRAYREYYKLCNTFVRRVPEFAHRWPNDGRIHCELMLTRTPSGRLCIAKGTPIEILRDVSARPEGVPIENVRAGDWAYTFDTNKRLCLRKVLWAGKTGHKRVIRLHWRGTGNHHVGHLDLTPEHRVRLITGDYKRAGDLKPGDRVLALSRGITNYGYGRLYAKNHTITAIEQLGDADVYDLEIEETACFVAGEICVHNSSKNPNLLAMPKHGKFAKAFRACFVPREGCMFVSADESQVELRTLAHLSQDPVMCAIFRGETRNPDGSLIDLHAATAQRIFGVAPKDQDESKHRLPSKAVNFGIPMGMTCVGLCLELRKGGMSVDEDDAQRWIDETEAMFAEVPVYKQRMIAEAERNGFVRCLSGRIRYVGGIRSKDDRVRSEAERFAFSTPIQEGAQYVAKHALAAAWHDVYVPERRLGHYVEPLLWTHDDLLSEVDTRYVLDVAPRLQKVLTTPPPGFSIPLSTTPEAGLDWSQMCKL